MCEKYVNHDGEYTHVGFCIKGQSFAFDKNPPWFKEDRLYILEATISGVCGSVTDVEGRGGLCVQLRDLDEVVKQYDHTTENYTAWQSLTDEFHPKELDFHSTQLQKEYDHYRGLYYDVDVIDLLAAAFPAVRNLRDNTIIQGVTNFLGRLCFGLKRSSSTDDPKSLPYDNYCQNWQFCSKLISHMYVDLGIFSNLVDPADIMPTDLVVEPPEKHIPNIFNKPIRFYLDGGNHVPHHVTKT